MTRESMIKHILTCKYFHEGEQEREWTDSEFSGLGWIGLDGDGMVIPFITAVWEKYRGPRTGKRKNTEFEWTYNQ